MEDLRRGQVGVGLLEAGAGLEIEVGPGESELAGVGATVPVRPFARPGPRVDMRAAAVRAVVRVVAVAAEATVACRLADNRAELAAEPQPADQQVVAAAAAAVVVVGKSADNQAGLVVEPRAAAHTRAARLVVAAAAEPGVGPAAAVAEQQGYADRLHTNKSAATEAGSPEAAVVAVDRLAVAAQEVPVHAAVVVVVPQAQVGRALSAYVVVHTVVGTLGPDLAGADMHIRTVPAGDTALEGTQADHMAAADTLVERSGPARVVTAGAGVAGLDTLRTRQRRE
jgi:hypothetical protein